MFNSRMYFGGAGKKKAVNVDRKPQTTQHLINTQYVNLEKRV